MPAQHVIDKYSLDRIEIWSCEATPTASPGEVYIHIVYAGKRINSAYNSCTTGFDPNCMRYHYSAFVDASGRERPALCEIDGSGFWRTDRCMNEVAGVMAQTDYTLGIVHVCSVNNYTEQNVQELTSPRLPFGVFSYRWVANDTMEVSVPPTQEALVVCHLREIGIEAELVPLFNSMLAQ